MQLLVILSCSGKKDQNYNLSMLSIQVQFSSYVFNPHVLEYKDIEPMGSGGTYLYEYRLTVLDLSNPDWLTFSWNLSSKSRCHLG